MKGFFFPFFFFLPVAQLLACVLITKLWAVAVKVGRSCSPDQKRHFKSGFWVLSGAGTHSWLRPAPTWQTWRVWRGVGHATLLCLRVYFAVIYPEPFSKASNKQQHKQDSRRDKWRSTKAFGPGVSRAVLKRELIDGTVITGTLWNQPLSADGTMKPRCKASSEWHWCQTHVSPRSPTEIDKPI